MIQLGPEDFYGVFGLFGPYWENLHILHCNSPINMRISLNVRIELQRNLGTKIRDSGIGTSREKIGTLRDKSRDKTRETN